MNRLSYDLHIHSCLSPCADDDMTPINIVNMAVLKKLDVIALTDHNSCKNCPAIIEAAKKTDLTVIPGMELCTSEEVHILCLFETLEDAMAFDDYVSMHSQQFPNNVLIFGKQLIFGNNDELTGIEKNLLLNATDISFNDVYSLVHRYNGIIIPAHIDKKSNSVLSNLGFIPPDSKFTCAEIKDTSKLDSLIQSNPYLENCIIITDSDAHSLECINEPVNYIYSNSKTIKKILNALTCSC